MDAEQLKKLERKESAHISEILTQFNTKNADLLVFDKFHTDNQWHDLWLAIFGILDDATLAPYHAQCLNTVRILTRDEFSLQTHFIEPEMATLLSLARITVSPKEEEPKAQLTAAEVEIIAEALKCLCNLVYQSSDCRHQCLRQHCVDLIVKRLGNASATHDPLILEHYNMKLLFLLTALESTARTRLQIDLNGLTYMTKWLDDKLLECATVATDDQLNIISELLKIMFTVTSTPDKSPHEYEIQSLHLTVVLRELLLRFGSLSTEKERSVITHTINLLTNISGSCLTELMGKCNGTEKVVKSTQCEITEVAGDATEANASAGVAADVSTATATAAAAAAATATAAPAPTSPTKCCALCFENHNVRSLEVLLNYLRSGLEQQAAEASSHELLSPVLTVLVKCARSDRIMRHYLRKEILPPLKDVSKRPEIGNQLRNHLCRFLTLPAMILRDLAAELLFVLCKEDVGRMIKYTGYGNAAGLFAKRGVLDCRRVEGTDYSSDSEDSDTEEYKQQQQSFNPVLGCVEPPKRNPLEGMSDEQKEYEALQLVNLLEKLRKDGIVQPALIDKDGKPQPLEHILQLQEELPQQQLEQKRKT